MKTSSSRVVTIALAVLTIAFIGARMLRNQRVDAARSGNHETSTVVQSRNVEEADAWRHGETPENSSPPVMLEAVRLQKFEAREEMFRNREQVVSAPDLNLARERLQKSVAEFLIILYRDFMFEIG